jgi:hypothetical protein
MREWTAQRAEAAKHPPGPIEVRPQDYVVTWLERIARLEKLQGQLAGRLDQLEAHVRELQQKLAPARRAPTKGEG